MQTTASDRSLVSRMMRASRAEPHLYEEVERDVDATSQAALVVLVVAIASGIGAIGTGSGIGGFIFGVIAAFVGWVVWSFVTYWVGKTLFKTHETRVTPGEMLRTLGFARAPGVLNVLGIIPFLGWIVLVVTSIWSIVLGVIAIRHAMDFSTGRAIATGLVAFIPVAIIQAILLAIPAAIF
ncbi:MAG: YIP1 family protein [Dehalococcoidia bacterium]